MPTGYTADVQDGKITEFADFAMQCARAFGACIMMRDDPADAPIPDVFEPCSYYADAIREDEAHLERLRAMNLDQRAVAAVEYNAAEFASWEKYETRKKETRQRYEHMLAQVRVWTPPTDDHTEMKKFMEEQLTNSIDFDCGGRQQPMPVPLKRDEWHHKEVAEVERRLARNREENVKEIERAAKRTAWVAALRKSLTPEPPTSSV
jgi:hypothetical protein